VRIGIDVSPVQSGHRLRGIGSYTRGLLAGLSQLDTGDQYIVYAWSGLKPSDLGAYPRNSQIVALPYPRLGRLSTLVAQQALALPQLLRQHPEIFHQPGITADVMGGTTPWVMTGRAVVTIHDLTPLLLPKDFLDGHRIRASLYRLTLRGVRRARQVIVDTEAVRTEVASHLGIEGSRVSVVPLAVDPDLAAAIDARPSPLPGMPESYFLTVAGDFPNKNLRTLLGAYAMACVKNGVPDLVIVGAEGPNVDQFRREHPAAAASLHRVDGLSMAQLAALYSHATAVILPSLSEGFGLPALDAMSTGTTVIASDIPAFREVVAGCAVMFPVLDARALADTMLEVAGSESLRREMAAAGRDRARGFSWERTARMTHDVYLRAAGIS
jgi:glycosyltransferase involved in cell wall biosynthesis